MYQVKAQTIIDSWTHSFKCNTIEEANEWIAKQQSKKLHWGRFRGAGEFPADITYDASLLLSERTDEEGNEFVTLSSDYSYEILDLSQDLDEVDKAAIQNRRAEYPTLETILHVLMDHGMNSQEWTDLQTQRQITKNKHPKSSR